MIVVCLTSIHCTGINSLVTFELLSRQSNFNLGHHKSQNGWFLIIVALSLFILCLLILHGKNVLAL